MTVGAVGPVLMPGVYLQEQDGEEIFPTAYWTFTSAFVIVVTGIF